MVEKNDALESLFSMGNLGIQLFNEKKYPASKMILVQTCTQLYDFIKQNQLQNSQAEQQLRNYLKYAESAKAYISQMEDIKNEYIKVIKESILNIKPNVFFKDIIGLENEKEVLKECLIYPNQRPDLFQGIRSPPKGLFIAESIFSLGILFFGPPGNGKTMLAKGVATECSGTFFNVSASTIVSKHLVDYLIQIITLKGDGEKLLKALFHLAYLHQPSVQLFPLIIIRQFILMKSIQYQQLGQKRSMRLPDVLKLNFYCNLMVLDKYQILIEQLQQELLIGLKSLIQLHLEDLFSLFNYQMIQTKRILIEQPDVKSISQLIKQTLKNVKCNIKEKEFDQIAKLYEGYSCADLMAVIKEACMAPLRKQKNLLTISVHDILPVTKQDLVDAQQKIQPSVSKKELQFFQKWAKNNNF